MLQVFCYSLYTVFEAKINVKIVLQKAIRLDYELMTRFFNCLQ
jgi:hypothetical protein